MKNMDFQSSCFGKGSIPSVYQKYESLRKQEDNYQQFQHNGIRCWYDHVNGIDEFAGIWQFGTMREKAHIAESARIASITIRRLSLQTVTSMQFRNKTGL